MQELPLAVDNGERDITHAWDVSGHRRNLQQDSQVRVLQVNLVTMTNKPPRTTKMLSVKTARLRLTVSQTQNLKFVPMLPRTEDLHHHLRQLRREVPIKNSVYDARGLIRVPAQKM